MTLAALACTAPSLSAVALQPFELGHAVCAATLERAPVEAGTVVQSATEFSARFGISLSLLVAAAAAVLLSAVMLGLARRRGDDMASWFLSAGAGALVTGGVVFQWVAIGVSDPTAGELSPVLVSVMGALIVLSSAFTCAAERVRPGDKEAP